MMPSTSDIYSFQKEIPKYYYTEIDAKFTNITRFNAIDIIPIKDFLDSLDYIGYGTTIIVKREGIKKFIDYIERRMENFRKSNQNETR
ncbi:hypothetical protein FACI_IFERC00001G0599 [Ferroplasma acidarmanus Fer1]|uniref:Uncharacterized protein n=2 Tax=Ferroplasma TaxID=74968 RepID=S0AQZ1_FERAC|nr:hypothetical protein FACI_IFERC00001G0599 [Ferroplasma acidarmanus Fer1]